MKNFLLLLAPALLSAFAAAGSPTAGGADPHRLHRAQMAAPLRTSTASYSVPDLELIDQTGTPVDLQAIIAHEAPVFINFIFTSCTTICPVQSAVFAQLQSQLRDQPVRFVSISIDPEEDTPERLQTYANQLAAEEPWVFLTGDSKDIVLAQKAFNAYRGGKMNHAALTLFRATSASPWTRLEGFPSASLLAELYRSTDDITQQQ